VKLGLGTAQFGLDYGITNARGRVAEPEASAILNCAVEAGIDTIDTAPLYGDAEQVLGRSMAGASGLRIITKTPKLDPSRPDGFAQAVEATFMASLARLKVSSVHGLLFHRATDLLEPQGADAWRVATRLRDGGLVGKIGLSITDFDAGRAIAKKHDIQIVQVPINIFDQRALRTGLVDEFKERGIEIHARSPLLQGVLAGDPGALPSRLSAMKERIERLGRVLADHGLTIFEAALRFVLEQPAVDRVVLGVTSLNELAKAILVARRNHAALPALGPWAIEDPDLVDPSRWRLAQ
jgi:aryl-alcohol dehydrogenase-like predicted oxidoreductase